MKLMAPIPGMSLTQEPGNSPWEQPPLYATVEESLGFYLKKFEDEEVIDDILFILEAGYPVASFVDMLTSLGVMDGYHTFDVKMLLSPVIHEYIVNLAEAAGIEYTEEMGPSKEERMKEKDKKRAKALLMKAMSMPVGPIPEETVEQAEDMMEQSEDDSTEEEDTPSLIKRRS